MIETILKTAAKAIHENVPAISKAGGAVQVVTMRDGQRIARNIPAVPPDQDASNQGNDYIAMLPADGESAVAFWQVLSTKPDDKQRATDKALPMVASCRLVVWANKRRLSPPDVSAVLLECVRQAQAADLTEEWLQTVRLDLLNVERRDKAIFSEYTFDEVDTQYLLEPYDFGSALFDVRYTILLTCLPEVAAVEPAC